MLKNEDSKKFVSNYSFQLITQWIPATDLFLRGSCGLFCWQE
jgi:hypothetical protein